MKLGSITFAAQPKRKPAPRPGRKPAPRPGNDKPKKSVPMDVPDYNEEGAKESCPAKEGEKLRACFA